MGMKGPVAGVFWMVLTGLFFVGVTAIVKHLDGRMPAAQSAFLRYAMGLVFLLPMIGTLRAARYDRRTILLFSLRGFVHAIGVILWFFAMTRISIAEVTAMNYLSPVYVSLGAVLVLREKMALRRIVAVIMALIGALIVLRPGVRALDLGHLAMLGTAVLFAAGYLVAKIMADEQPPSVVVAMLSIFVTLFLAPFAAMDWVTPTARELAWLFGVAILATSGHFTMTLAFRAAPITVTQPVTFLQLVWATILGVVMFGEPLDGWVIFGGLVILASVIFMTWREAVAKRRAFAQATGPV
ncbi:DMT family transporter [Oceaniglobus ichthyenteri]|uniref:DMT family transporter n=1 Tax=Oceaniglobus ichthyenteri TaxID=2136177 RepID=UPI000D37D0DC|nr:DMT family transporter [Oceaniglobus ichthyenteri]